jgi:hypothetical protein
MHNDVCTNFFTNFILVLSYDSCVLHTVIIILIEWPTDNKSYAVRVRGKSATSHAWGIRLNHGFKIYSYCIITEQPFMHVH